MSFHVCCQCQRATEAAVPVRDVERQSGAGWSLYACPDCVHLIPPGPLTTDELSIRHTRH
jgi:hypothetical protein